MEDRLPIWSYDEKSGKVANTFPYYSENENFQAAIKLKIADGWEDAVKKDDDNFTKATSLSFDLVDVVKRMTGGDLPEFGSFSFNFSNERDEDGELLQSTAETQLIVYDNQETPATIQEEIIGGSAKENLISYMSRDGRPVMMEVLLSVFWHGEQYGENYKVQCWNGDTLIQEFRAMSSEEQEDYTFDLRIFDDNGQMVTYEFKQVLSDENWETTGNNLIVDYDSHLESHSFENTYIEPTPSWPGLILWADASTPIENRIWKNQIEGQNDIEITGTASIEDNAVVFQPGRNFAGFYFPYGSRTILENYTLYAVIKSSGINTSFMNQSGAEDDWIAFINKNEYRSSANGFRLSRWVSRPTFSSSMTGNNSEYNYFCESSQYHVYAFSKENNSTTVKVFLDGQYKESININNLSVSSPLIAINTLSTQTSSLWNQNTNYYKLVAFSNQTHQDSDVIAYSQYIINKYNIDTTLPSEINGYLNEVRFNPNCILNTNYILTSNSIDLRMYFNLSNTGYDTYVNNKGNWAYTDNEEILSIISSASNSNFVFNVKYNNTDETRSDATDGASNLFYCGYKDYVQYRPNPTSPGQVWLKLSDATRGTNFWQNSAIEAHDIFTPKDSSLKLFGKNGCGAYGSIQSITLMDDNKIIRNFIPAYKTVNSSNIYGLYDIIGGVFYESSGTNSFSL